MIFNLSEISRRACGSKKVSHLYTTSNILALASVRRDLSAIAFEKGVPVESLIDKSHPKNITTEYPEVARLYLRCLKQRGIPDAVLENIYNTLQWKEQPLEDEAEARPVEVDEVETDWEAGVKAAAESDEEFPINFEDAWRWVQYSTKQKGKDRLIADFKLGTDYVLLNQKVEQSGRGGHNRQTILLTSDCFKQFCMMANTSRGKEVRLYFLQCERELKRLKATPQQQQQNILQDPVINMVLADMDKVGVAEAFKLGWKYESLKSLCPDRASDLDAAKKVFSPLKPVTGYALKPVTGYALKPVTGYVAGKLD
jgi:phage anti-repressor protein